MRRDSDVYIRALDRALELAGDEALAKYLGVSAVRLRGWVARIGPIPEDIFLKLVDLILAERFAKLRRK